MTYGELKTMDIYKNANDTTLCINGEDEVDEMYYPEELDSLLVIGTGGDGNRLLIDILCENWNDRFNVGWVAK